MCVGRAGCAAAAALKHEICRHLKEISLYVLDTVELTGLGDPQEGFLHEIVHVRRAAQAAQEKALEPRAIASVQKLNGNAPDAARGGRTLASFSGAFLVPRASCVVPRHSRPH